MLRIITPLLICFCLFSFLSCKRDKVVSIKNDPVREVIMFGHAQEGGNQYPVIWTSSTRKMNFLPDKPQARKILGVHSIEQVGKKPVLSYIGIAKGEAGPSYYDRVVVFNNGERQELSSLAGITLDPLLKHEVVSSYLQDDHGTTYVGCAGNYFYKIDPTGKVTHTLLKTGTLVLTSQGIKSVQMHYDLSNGFEFTVADLNRNLRTFPYANNLWYDSNWGSSSVSEKRTFVFLDLFDKYQTISSQLLTFNNETGHISLQEISVTNTGLNFVHSIIHDGILYVVGSDAHFPFYLAIQLSDQQGPLKIKKTYLETKSTSIQTTVRQILVVNKDVYVCGYNGNAAIWKNGQLMEIDNNGIDSFPDILTSY